MIVSSEGALGVLASAVVDTRSISLCSMAENIGGRVRKWDTWLIGVAG